MNEKNFGHIGITFQERLLKTIIEDKKFGYTIVDVIESSYFDNNSFRFIMENIKEYYEKYNSIPSYNGLNEKILGDLKGVNETQTRVFLDTVDNIKNLPQDNAEEQTKSQAMNFCKQQVLKKALKEVDVISSNGDFENYHKIEEIIQKALQVGQNTDDIQNVFENIKDALKEDSRLPIPTGILGIDNLLNGGLGRGELGVVLAPTGTGKTTLLTKFSNEAYNHGYNVLQIFFEDNVNNIKRKHFTIWSKIAPDEQPANAEQVEEAVQNAQNNSKGQLKLLKFPSDSVTMSEIKTKIRKMIADGFKIDLVTLDYIDCVTADRNNYNEEWKGDGAIMRQLEAMTSEFEIAVWTATQGNRASIASEVVTTDQMGGSIKKAQIGHVVISIGKTLEQKEHNLGTLTLLKSRIGQDGVVFQNCTFDNKYLHIDTETQNTLLGHKEEKEEERKNRTRELYKAAQEKNLIQ